MCCFNLGIPVKVAMNTMFFVTQVFCFIKYAYVMSPPKDRNNISKGFQ